MGPGTIEHIIDLVGNQVAGAIGALVPVGLALSGSFTVLSILFLGASIISGANAVVPQIIRVTGAAAATFWGIREWPAITHGTLDAARAAVGLMIGGYSGPSMLFQMANDVTGRVLAEYTSFSITAPVTSIADGIMGALSAVLIWLGLAITGLLAVLAEFQLLIGAAVAPLVLPALAFGLTNSLGWAPVRFMVSAGLRVVIMGLVSYVMAGAVTSVISVGGTDTPLTHEQVMTLMGVALLTALVGICCNSLARDLVGGGPGSLGLNSITRTGNVMSSAAGAVMTAGGVALGGIGAAARVGGHAAGRTAGAAVKIGRSSGSGSAFSS
jgi:hypothetical protein